MAAAAIVIATQRAPWSNAPLALVPWSDDATLIEFTVRQLQRAGVRDIEVVLGEDADEIIPLISIDNVEPIIDPRWRSGRASSLRVGASAVPRGTEHGLLANVDEPRPAWVYERMIDEHVSRGSAVTRPAYRETAGAPIVVNDRVLAELRNVVDDAAADAIINGSEGVNTIPFDDEIVVLRLDSKAAYERARALMAG